MEEADTFVGELLQASTELFQRLQARAARGGGESASSSRLGYYVHAENPSSSGIIAPQPAAALPQEYSRNSIIQHKSAVSIAYYQQMALQKSSSNTSTAQQPGNVSPQHRTPSPAAASTRRNAAASTSDSVADFTSTSSPSGLLDDPWSIDEQEGLLGEAEDIARYYITSRWVQLRAKATTAAAAQHDDDEDASEGSQNNNSRSNSRNRNRSGSSSGRARRCFALDAVESNHIVDESSATLVRIWTSREEARLFHRAIKYVREAAKDLLLPACFVSVHSVLFAMNGLPVSVTWLPPLVVPSSLSGALTSSSKRTTTGSDDDDSAAGDGDGLWAGMRSFVAAVEQAWRTALSPGPFVNALLADPTQGSSTAAAVAAASAAVSQHLGLYLAQDNRFYCITTHHARSASSTSSSLDQLLHKKKHVRCEMLLTKCVNVPLSHLSPDTVAKEMIYNSLASSILECTVMDDQHFVLGEVLHACGLNLGSSLWSLREGLTRNYGVESTLARNEFDRLRLIIDQRMLVGAFVDIISNPEPAMTRLQKLFDSSGLFSFLRRFVTNAEASDIVAEVCQRKYLTPLSLWVTGSDQNKAQSSSGSLSSRYTVNSQALFDTESRFKIVVRAGALCGYSFSLDTLSPSPVPVYLCDTGRRSLNVPPAATPEHFRCVAAAKEDDGAAVGAIARIPVWSDCLATAVPVQTSEGSATIPSGGHPSTMCTAFSILALAGRALGASRNSEEIAFVLAQLKATLASLPTALSNVTTVLLDRFFIALDARDKKLLDPLQLFNMITTSHRKLASLLQLAPSVTSSSAPEQQQSSSSSSSQRYSILGERVFASLDIFPIFSRKFVREQHYALSLRRNVRGRQYGANSSGSFDCFNGFARTEWWLWLGLYGQSLLAMFAPPPPNPGAPEHFTDANEEEAPANNMRQKLLASWPRDRTCLVWFRKLVLPGLEFLHELAANVRAVVPLRAVLQPFFLPDGALTMLPHSPLAVPFQVLYWSFALLPVLVEQQVVAASGDDSLSQFFLAVLDHFTTFATDLFGPLATVSETGLSAPTPPPPAPQESLIAQRSTSRSGSVTFLQKQQSSVTPDHRQSSVEEQRAATLQNHLSALLIRAIPVLLAISWGKRLRSVCPKNCSKLLLAMSEVARSHSPSDPWCTDKLRSALADVDLDGAATAMMRSYSDASTSTVEAFSRLVAHVRSAMLHGDRGEDDDGAEKLLVSQYMTLSAGASHMITTEEEFARLRLRQQSEDWIEMLLDHFHQTKPKLVARRRPSSSLFPPSSPLPLPALSSPSDTRVDHTATPEPFFSSANPATFTPPAAQLSHLTEHLIAREETDASMRHVYVQSELGAVQALEVRLRKEIADEEDLRFECVHDEHAIERKLRLQEPPRVEEDDTPLKRELRQLRPSSASMKEVVARHAALLRSFEAANREDIVQAEDFEFQLFYDEFVINARCQQQEEMDVEEEAAARAEAAASATALRSPSDTHEAFNAQQHPQQPPFYQQYRGGGLAGVFSMDGWMTNVSSSSSRIGGNDEQLEAYLARVAAVTFFEGYERSGREVVAIAEAMYRTKHLELAYADVQHKLIRWQSYVKHNAKTPLPTRRSVSRFGTSSPTQFLPRSSSSLTPSRSRMGGDPISARVCSPNTLGPELWVLVTEDEVGERLHIEREQHLQQSKLFFAFASSVAVKHDWSAGGNVRVALTSPRSTSSYVRGGSSSARPMPSAGGKLGYATPDGLFSSLAEMRDGGGRYGAGGQVPSPPPFLDTSESRRQRQLTAGGGGAKAVFGADLLQLYDLESQSRGYVHSLWVVTRNELLDTFFDAVPPSALMALSSATPSGPMARATTTASESRLEQHYSTSSHQQQQGFLSPLPLKPQQQQRSITIASPTAAATSATPIRPDSAFSGVFPQIHAGAAWSQSRTPRR